jgi:hypothetical protein
MTVMVVAEEIPGLIAVALRGVPPRSRTDARQRTLGHRAAIKGSGGLVTEARDELALPSFARLVLPVPRPVTGTRDRLLTFRPTVRGAVVGLQEGLMARGTARRACAGPSPSFSTGLAFPRALGS